MVKCGKVCSAAKHFRIGFRLGKQRIKKTWPDSVNIPTHHAIYQQVFRRVQDPIF
jgi:hypothetical protein